MKNIKNTLLLLILGSTLLSCDKSTMMEANIKNATSQALIITFASSSEGTRTEMLNPDKIRLFQDGFSSTGGFLEPSLAAFDSVYIENEDRELLKVFKPNSTGKNIYNVGIFWDFKATAGDSFYKYEYPIENKDLEESTDD